MTLRQILDVLWKRRWIIVSVVAIALVTAAGYLQLRDVTYESAGTVRMNAAVTEAALGGELGGVAVELDDQVVTSPAVLEPAAAEVGESADQLAGEIDVFLDSEERLATVSISAVGPTPDVAQARAIAVIEAYQVYIDEQMAALLEQLQVRQQEAVAEVRAIQQVLEADPADPIANVNLAAALTRMQTATGAIETITDAGTSNTTVLEAPSPGGITVPTAMVVLLLALATGLVVGIAVALIRDQFDNRLRGDEEVEELTGIASAGELSWDRKLAAMDPPLPVASNDRTDLSERLRTLRSNLAVFLPPREAAFVVTSVEPGDGKSFVSANLALAWARAGKRVILVGGDLRRPNLAKYFGDAADGEGLSDILEEAESGAHVSAAAVDARLNATRYRRLQILPSGAEPAEPADLFAGAAVGEVISYLRMLADVVIIDSPPAIGMADAALLAAHTDGAIVLATARRTDRVRLVETVEALRAAGTEVLGIVTNRSRRKLPKSYSSYYVTARSAAPESTAPAPSTAEPFVLDADVHEDEAPLRRDQPRQTETTPAHVEDGIDALFDTEEGESAETSADDAPEDLDVGEGAPGTGRKTSTS